MAGRAGRPGGAYGKTNSTMKRKLAGLFIAAVLIFVLLAIRISYISASKKDQYSKQVLSQTQSQYSSTSIPYKRGDILDANGTVLATSRKVYNVILDCYVVNSDEEYYEPTVEAAVSLLGADEGQVRSLLTGAETKDSRYRIIVKGLPVEDKQAFEEYLAGDESISETERERRNLINGLWFEEDYVRSYPFGSLACDVIGFTNDGESADWGIEGYYNNTLNGVNGRRYGYYNADSDLEQTIIDPENGNSVVTSIDVNIQQIAEKYISQFMEAMRNGPNGERGAANVAVLIMDPRDASVLAMASTDPYDLNDPRNLAPFYPQAQIDAMTDEQKVTALNAVWRNYCISDSYEPGSTFKPVTMAAALEDGTLAGSESFYCDGYEIVAGTTIKCHKLDGHGEQTLSGVIRDSCNDAMMQIVSLLGVDEFCKYQEIFNFGVRTGIDLAGEAGGILHSPSTMGEVDLATASFGQGFTCTMVQEAAAVSSIINGGYYYEPHIADRIVNDAGQTVRTINPVLVRQTVSSQVSDMVRSYMVASVGDDVSPFAKVDGYSCGGKSGTAQKVPRGNGKYLSSFIGFWPAEQPQLLCYVVVDEPNVENQATNAYAQYITRQIMSEVLPYKSIFPDEAKKNTEPVDLGSLLLIEGEDVSGYAIADTNVPPPETSDEVVEGGDFEEDRGFTNEEAGLAG